MSGPTNQRLVRWVERLVHQSLPALALTKRRVPQLLSGVSNSHQELQRVIIRDPGYTLAVLRRLSSLPNAPEEPVSTLSHAIALLGVSQVAQIGSQLESVNNLLGSRGRAPVYRCYSIATHATHFVDAWARIKKWPNPEELTTATLLMGLAEMLLWIHAADRMRQVELMTQRKVSRRRAEQAIFGFTLDELSLGLASRWRLNRLLQASLQNSGAFEPRPLSMMLATALAKSSLASWTSEETLGHSELVAELIDASLDQAIAQTHTTAAEAARELWHLPLPLAVSPLLPFTTGRAVHNDPPAAAPTPKQTTRIKPPPGALSLPYPPSMQHKVVHLFRDLKASTGVERIMLALLDEQQTRLRAKFTMGVDKSAALRRFQHPASGRHLFELMLKKPQGVWLNMDNQQKLLPMLTDEARNTMNIAGFYLCSLFVEDRPMGILYADMHDPFRLNKQGFIYFKSLAKRLSRELDAKP